MLKGEIDNLICSRLGKRTKGTVITNSVMALFNHFVLLSGERYLAINPGGGGGGGTPLHGLYRYVRSQRVWFFSRFGHHVNRVSILVINRIWFLHSCLELGMIF